MQPGEGHERERPLNKCLYILFYLISACSTYSANVLGMNKHRNDHKTWLSEN